MLDGLLSALTTLTTLTTLTATIESAADALQCLPHGLECNSMSMLVSVLLLRHCITLHCTA
jgi:hypothetical protein